jgi:hypothetical protein
MNECFVALLGSIVLCFLYETLSNAKQISPLYRNQNKDAGQVLTEHLKTQLEKKTSFRIIVRKSLKNVNIRRGLLPFCYYFFFTKVCLLFSMEKYEDPLNINGIKGNQNLFKRAPAEFYPF